MFLGKLWLRIKGEVLAVKEDMLYKPRSRKPADELPKKFEGIFKGTVAERQWHSGDREGTEEVDYDVKQKEKSNDSESSEDREPDQATEPSSPNPRRLG